MTVAQIRSLLARQMSTHQSTLPVLEAIIEHLADNEGYKNSADNIEQQVPAASVTEAAPLSTETAEAPAPPKEADQKSAPAQE